MPPRTPTPRLLSLSASLALFTQSACPGFGDRLAPDAGPVAPDADEFGVTDDALPPNAEAGPPPPDAEPDAAAPPPTFEPEIADFLQRHCSLCHGATPVGGAPYAIVTWAEAVDHAAAIVDRTVDKRDMPPGGGLVTDEERERLTAWVAGGTLP